MSEVRYGVDFWVLKKGEKAAEHKNAACFSKIWGKQQDAIRYMAYPPEEFHTNKFTNEILDFYLGFVRRLLTLPGCAKWKMRKLKDRRVLFRLETNGLKDKQCLFYLTWFRYIQEMPMFPIILFQRKEEGDSDEVLFRKLQEIHYESLAGKIKNCYINTNHGLIYKGNYGVNSAGEPITIERLVSNIKENPPSVFEYFK